MNTTVLKPGLLVSLKTACEGGVTYTRKDLDAAGVATALDDAARAEVARWETTKIVEDAEEHAAALKVQSEAGQIIRKVAVQSAFGLLCPTADEAALDGAIARSRALAEGWNTSDWNGRPKTTRVSVFVMKGRIAESDGEATRAIASEIRSLLDEVKSGLLAGDVSAARKAANRAREVGQVLDESAGRRVSEAIAEARRAAREIVKRIGDGEDRMTATANAVAEIKLEALDSARFAFLDLEEPAAAPGEALPPASPVDLDVGDDGAHGEGEGADAAPFAAAPPVDL